MKVTSTGNRCSVRGGFLVALLQLCFLTSMLQIPASARLPDFYQSSVEYRSIFDDSRLLESLNGHLMTSVTQDGHTILIEAENGCVIRGSMRDLPRHIPPRPPSPSGICFTATPSSTPTVIPTGARSFEVSELKVDSGCEDEVISPRNGGPTSATRLQDFKNLLNKLDDTHYALFRSGNIEQIELVGTNTFRISSYKSLGRHADIPFTPTVYAPHDDPHDML